MVRPRGEAHGAFGRCKKSFVEASGYMLETLASGPRPDAEGHDVWARRQGLWFLVLEVREGLFLAGKTDFEEALTPSFDPRAQHINRGAELAPKTHQETPSRVPATPPL